MVLRQLLCGQGTPRPWPNEFKNNKQYASHEQRKYLHIHKILFILNVVYSVPAVGIWLQTHT